MDDQHSRGRLDRRTLLRRSAIAALGATALAVVGCGNGAGDGDAGNDGLAAPAPPESGSAPAPTESAAQSMPESDETPPRISPAQGAPAPDEPARPRQPGTTTPSGWTALEPSGPLPSPRTNPILAFDSAQRVLYLHGGRGDGTALDDLWAFDLVTSTWTALDPPGERPAVRFSHSGIFDSRRGALVIFAGQAQGFAFHSDVWAFDTQVGRWTRIAAPHAGPTSRYGLGFGYDPEGDRFLISHGFTDAGRFDDTWAFGLRAAAWQNVSPATGRPGRRCLHTCAYDPATRSLFLFGGQDNSSPYLGDTWLLAAGHWDRVDEPAPAARRFPASVADAGVAWLLGGLTANGAVADLWRLDLTERRWEAVALPPGPAARHSHAVAFDRNARAVYQFGGADDTGDERNDLWVVDLPE